MFICCTDNLLERDILPNLPLNLASLLGKLPGKAKQQLTEIRLREGRPLMVMMGERDWFVSSEGQLVSVEESAYVPGKEDMVRVLQIMSKNSVYALEEELRNGFLTLRGGHRVGMAGQTTVERGRVKALKNITSFNIRIARQVIGSADRIMPYLVHQNAVLSTLIISPPHAGKTTLLRDIIRQASVGIIKVGLKGKKVGVVDERSEIAGSWQGVPQNDLGPRTDILDSCPKAQGMMMLIRSMSPELLAIDELGRPEDVEAVWEAIHAGVALVTTAHARSISEANKRPVLKNLFENRIFQRIIVLSNTHGVGTVEDIIDGENLESLLRGTSVREVQRCCSS